MKIILFLLSPLFICFAQPTIDLNILRDVYNIRGQFYLSIEEAPPPTVIFLNDILSNEKIIGLGKRLSECGINVLTINLNDTTVKKGNSNYENNLKDIEAVYTFIHNVENIKKYNIDTNRVVLGGWCSGGGISMVYASLHPEIKKVFYLAGNDLGYSVDPKFDYIENVDLLVEKTIFLIGAWNDTLTSIESHLIPFYRALQDKNAKKIKIATFQDNQYFEKTRNQLVRTLVDWIKFEKY